MPYLMKENMLIRWLQSLKKDKRWGSSDRKFVAETIYEIKMERLYGEIARG
jgi:hypothetical protein